MKQEDIIEFQLLQAELEQIQGFLQRIDEQRVTINNLLQDLDSFAKLQGGEELLFPITNGIFAKGTLQDNKTLHVNVGRGVVVPRTVEQTQDLIKQQMNSLIEQQEAAVKQQENLFIKLEELEKKVSKDV